MLFQQRQSLLAFVAVVAVAGAGLEGTGALQARDAAPTPVFHNLVGKRAPGEGHSYKAVPGKRAEPTPAAAAIDMAKRAPDEGHSYKAVPGKRDAAPTPVYNDAMAKRTPDDSHSIKVGPPAEKRQVKPSQPLSQMGPPNFPPDIPSCYNCQQKYPSLSSCMAASAVFQNATNIFNNPLQYIDVLKCSCTDTFQAVYPQCLQCFQQTNQCQYLGTDSAGTGAPDIVTNLRNVCGFASSIFGGAEAKNYPNTNSTVTPTSPPPYGDGTKTDQTAGPIFGAAAPGLSVETVLPIVATVTFVVIATLISM